MWEMSDLGLVNRILRENFIGLVGCFATIEQSFRQIYKKKNTSINIIPTSQFVRYVLFE